MKLSYTLAGPSDAPVLVLSSSLGTTGEMWQPQLARLRQHWRVLAFDHPGHGSSTLGDGRVTVPDIGEAVLDLLDGLGCERFSFCGLSLGGMVGQWLAAHAPERIERLVLCCTSARLPPEPYLERAATVREKGTATIADAVLSRWFTPAFRAQQPAAVALYRRMLEATPAAGYAACCEAVAAFDGRGDLASISAPTLIIAGADDPAIAIEHTELLLDTIPGAQLRIIAGAAHLANVEQPAAVGEAIKKHMRGTLND